MISLATMFFAQDQGRSIFSGSGPLTYNMNHLRQPERLTGFRWRPPRRTPCRGRVRSHPSPEPPIFPFPEFLDRLNTLAGSGPPSCGPNSRNPQDELRDDVHARRPGVQLSPLSLNERQQPPPRREEPTYVSRRLRQDHLLPAPVLQRTLSPSAGSASCWPGWRSPPPPGTLNSGRGLA